MSITSCRLLSIPKTPTHLLLLLLTTPLRFGVSGLLLLPLTIHSLVTLKESIALIIARAGISLSLFLEEMMGSLRFGITKLRHVLWPLMLIRIMSLMLLSILIFLWSSLLERTTTLKSTIQSLSDRKKILITTTIECGPLIHLLTVILLHLEQTRQQW